MAEPLKTPRPQPNSLAIPAPILGWNTKDPISEMDPFYAHEAENFFSNGSTVDLRLGTLRHAYNIGPGVIQTLIEYTMPDGTNKLLAVAADDRTYDVTAGGGSPVDLSAGGTLPVANSDEVLGCNYRGLIWIKDQNTHDVRTWNGVSASLSTPGFIGPGGNDRQLTYPHSYKNRLYFLGNDASIWYSGIDAVTGTLTQFDVQSVLRLGGKLAFGGGFSQGNQAAEALVYVMISTRGEVLLYQGDYPGSATWGLVGQYIMPKPAGGRSFFYYGTTLCIITYQGLVDLAEVVKGEPTLRFMSEKINSEFTDSIIAQQNNKVMGCYWPKGNMIIINMPTGNSAGSVFVMSTVNGSWWKWTGLGANAWSLFNDHPHFAGTRQVFKAYTGEFDDDPANPGTPKNRTLKLRWAYNYFGERSIRKQFTEARVIMKQSQGFQLTADMNVDYEDTAATQICEPDNTDTSYKYYQRRIGLRAQGKAGSFRIDQTVTTKKMSIYAIEVLWNDGDIV